MSELTKRHRQVQEGTPIEAPPRPYREFTQDEFELMTSVDDPMQAPVPVSIGGDIRFFDRALTPDEIGELFKRTMEEGPWTS